MSTATQRFREDVAALVREKAGTALLEKEEALDGTEGQGPLH